MSKQSSRVYYLTKVDLQTSPIATGLMGLWVCS